MTPLTVVLSAEPFARGRRYVLADAQFAKYRPPTHPYLSLLTGDEARAGGLFPAGAAISRWEALTDRLERVPGGPAGRAVLPTFTCPFPGRLADLDHWYTTFHVPQVVAVEGFAAGQRFARSDPDPQPPHEQLRLALYELDADDPQLALDRLQAALGMMEPTDALDGSTIASWCFVPDALLGPTPSS